MGRMQEISMRQANLAQDRDLTTLVALRKELRVQKDEATDLQKRLEAQEKLLDALKADVSALRAKSEAEPEHVK